MRRRLGCWSVVSIAGLAALFPGLFNLAHCAGKPAARHPPSRPPACLEVWVRLRSYRGCPLLAAAGGYRLGLFCFPGGRSSGALVFSGPFQGRAYLSERPVPLGGWVHLAGLEGALSLPAEAGSPPTPATATALAMAGRDVVAGRMAAWGEPLPLGYDPWESRAAAAKAALAAGACRYGADCQGIPGPPDGEIGAWRLSRGWRSLSQVAAGRGTPWRLAPLPAAPPTASGRRTAGGITWRGWQILAAGLLLALAMAGAGLALRWRGGAGAPGERHLRRLAR